VEYRFPDREDLVAIPEIVFQPWKRQMRALTNQTDLLPKIVAKA
jgi:hypothetical protein